MGKSVSGDMTFFGEFPNFEGISYSPPYP